MRAEEIHERWQRANTDHPTEIKMLEQALLEAYRKGQQDAVTAMYGFIVKRIEEQVNAEQKP